LTVDSTYFFSCQRGSTALAAAALGRCERDAASLMAKPLPDIAARRRHIALDASTNEGGSMP
jgi:hypothetical protein